MELRVSVIWIGEYGTRACGNISMKSSDAVLMGKKQEPQCIHSTYPFNLPKVFPGEN